MSVTRTVKLDDLTPAELAQAFCDMGCRDQAAFFEKVWEIGLTWHGAGWCQQSCAIVEASDSDAREAIRTLASHLPAEDLAWIAAAGADA
jgi:hypothetical protein